MPCKASYEFVNAWAIKWRLAKGRAGHLWGTALYLSSRSELRGTAVVTRNKCLGSKHVGAGEIDGGHQLMQMSILMLQDHDAAGSHLGCTQTHGLPMTRAATKQHQYRSTQCGETQHCEWT